MWRVCVLIRLFLLIPMLVILPCNIAFCTDENISIEVEKTFDHGTLIDHRITAGDSDNTVVMIFSQRRRGEGSNQITESFLSFRPQRRTDNRPFRLDETRVFITKILQTLHDKFGEDLKLTSMTGSGFLNVHEIQGKNLRAFAGHAPWQAYLKANPQQYSQHDAHKMVVHRWKQKHVYADMIRIFQSAGYTLELSGFEKLFVQRADKFGCYTQIKPTTIKPTDRFPYPGMVHFTIKKDGAPTPSK